MSAYPIRAAVLRLPELLAPAPFRVAVGLTLLAPIGFRDPAVVPSILPPPFVLTHDLSFFADLRRAAKDQGVACEARTLSADEWAVGLIEEDIPFGARSVKDRVNVLRKMIADMKEAGSAGRTVEARDICRRFYSRLRSTWERFVETEMFGEVVQRLEKEVRPGLLHQVAVTDEIRTAVTHNYTRCSDIIDAHDTPAAAGQASPTTAEMEADLKQVEDARKLVLAKRKTP